MDVRMPDLDGPEATREILEHDPSIHVLALTVVSDDADVDAVVDAGACGFVAKDTPIDGVVMAVRAVAQGVACSGSCAGTGWRLAVAACRRGRDPDPGPIDQLSAHELEVLARAGLIASGMENAEMPKTLGIRSRTTAKNHVSNILAKLGLTRRRRPPH